MSVNTEKLKVENNNIDPIILSILLKDRTTNKNIIWATDNYKEQDKKYTAKKQITMEAITTEKIIKPRLGKTQIEQENRSRDKAEVFTPSWMCNIQNNLVDEMWFGKKDVFNKELSKSWKANEQKVTFPENKTWQKYIKSVRLEITCGEAPYIVSRYDTVTGKVIPIKERIGLLDRKLRVICENVETKEEWLEWAEIAYKSIYGYDWQGDNILIARENLFFTLQDYYREMFKQELDMVNMIIFAEIISWNIWQMDGAKGVIPNSCRNDKKDKKTDGKNAKECIGCAKDNIYKHNGKYCKIMDWEKEKIIKFIDLINKGK